MLRNTTIYNLPTFCLDTSVRSFILLYIWKRIFTLGYPVAKGIVVLPKSVTSSRITANLTGAIRAFETLTKETLTKADVERLDALAAAGKQKRFVACLLTRYESFIDGLPIISRCL